MKLLSSGTPARFLPLAFSALLCFSACKKKQADSGGDATTANNPAASAATADAASSTASSAPAAPGAVASAPYNPSLKVPPPGPPVNVNGVTVNVQNAEKAISTASWDANVSLSALRDALQYRDFPRALGCLQKVSSDPSVNDSQRAVLQQVMEEVKQAAATQPR